MNGSHLCRHVRFVVAVAQQRLLPRFPAASAPVLLGVLLSACCCSPPAASSTSSGSSAPTSQSPASTREPSKSPSRPPEVATQVDLATLLADYKNNEVRADQAYKGRLIETTGTVGDVKKSLGNSMYLTLGTGRLLEIPVLQCSLPDDQSSEAASLDKGDRVTVRGRVSGLMFNVHLRDCRIQ